MLDNASTLRAMCNEPLNDGGSQKDHSSIFLHKKMVHSMCKRYAKAGKKCTKQVWYQQCAIDLSAMAILERRSSYSCTLPPSCNPQHGDGADDVEDDVGDDVEDDGDDGDGAYTSCR